MRKYYIVAKKDFVNPGKTIITLTDAAPRNGNGYEYLKEVEAASYADALAMVRFEKNENGGGASI